MNQDVFSEICKSLSLKDTKAIYLTCTQYYHYFSENRRKTIVEAAKGIKWCTCNASIEGCKLALKGVPIEDYVPTIIMATTLSRVDIITYLYTTYPLILNQLLGWVLLFAVKYADDETVKYILPKVKLNKVYWCYDHRLDSIYGYKCLYGEFILSKFLSRGYIWAYNYSDPRCDSKAIDRIKSLISTPRSFQKTD